MFHDTRFPTRFQYGAQATPMFKTMINENSAGYEQRNQLWAQARRKYSYENALETEDQYLEVLAFFMARRGPAYSFRVKDWFDYRVETGEGIMRGTVSNELVGNGSTTTFQLSKLYPDSVATFERPIYLPVDQSVYTTDEDNLVAFEVYVSAVLMNPVDYTVDYLTGVITFDTAPADEATLTWTGQFDVPVRFETDELPSTYAQWNDLQAGLNMIEVRAEEEAP